MSQSRLPPYDLLPDKTNIPPKIIEPTEINIVDIKAFQYFLMFFVGILKISNAPLAINGSYFS